MNIYALTDAQGNALSAVEINDMLKNLGISAGAIEQGEAAIEQEAQQDGIKDLEKSLQDMVAAKDPKVKGSGDKVKGDFEQKLESLGIPKEIIQQGKEAVEAYAAQNNITLPKPPSGAELNLLS